MSDIFRIRYKHKKKPITTKYRFPSIENFLDWSNIKGYPYKEYTNLELVIDD